MKNKYLVIFIIFLSIIAIISSSKNKRTAFLNNDINVISFNDTPNRIETKNITVRIKNNNDEIIKLDLEDYIIGVVSAEMPAEFNEEALKAQAVAARTYALKKIENSNGDYDLVTDTRNQVYINEDGMKNKWGSNYIKYFNKICKAVNDTKGEVMKYHDETIYAYYFAISNGKTENSEYAFGDAKDYLVSVESNFEENLKGFLVTKEFSKEEFLNSLGLSGNIIIKDIIKTPSNRIETIVINNKKFTGKEIRTLLKLRSTDFNIEVNDKVYITTKGYGHGVGMSQYGANILAKEGKKYDEILKYYYKNINIVQISV